MGGSVSANKQLEKQLQEKIEELSIPTCKIHSDQYMSCVCTEERCRSKLDLICLQCQQQLRENPHKNHRLQNLKEILQDLFSTFRRIDQTGMGQQNPLGDARNNIVASDNILGNPPLGSYQESEITESFKKLSNDLLILSANCKELSEMIMQSLIQANEDVAKTDINYTRSQTVRAVQDIVATASSKQELQFLQLAIKKLQPCLKFSEKKAKFIDNDGSFRRQLKKGTAEWLNSIWEEIKRMAEGVANIKKIGPLLPLSELLDSMQEKQRQLQADSRIKELLKHQESVQSQESFLQDLEKQSDQNNTTSQRRTNVRQNSRLRQTQQSRNQASNGLSSSQSSSSREQKVQEFTRQREELVAQMEEHVKKCGNSHCRFVEFGIETQFKYIGWEDTSRMEGQKKTDCAVGKSMNMLMRDIINNIKTC